jgi:hypothetical protein
MHWRHCTLFTRYALLSGTLNLIKPNVFDYVLANIVGLLCAGTVLCSGGHVHCVLVSCVAVSGRLGHAQTSTLWRFMTAGCVHAG